MHPTKIAASLCLVLSAGGFSVPAMAQSQSQPPQHSPSPFDGADANGDGKVSKSEYVAARNARFDRADKNRDGGINRADFPRAADNPQALARVDAMIASADSNHDGSVSKTELSGASTPFFDRVDADHDGFVTTTEIAVARQAAAARKK